jgi:N-acyl-L-homoserine lactone synthetase
MIRYIEMAGRNECRTELLQYFRLRKQVFCDQLGWVQPKPGGLEHDEYDELYNIYILNIDDQDQVVTGGVRLMPTTGPTLMQNVWADMLPSPDDFRSPNIWEATRFCVDDCSNRTRKGNFVNRATLALSLAVMEFGSANGITHVIGVCERKFFDMSSAYGAHAEIISQRIDENGVEVCCGIWSTVAERSTLSWARGFLGDAEPALVRKVA